MWWSTPSAAYAAAVTEELPPNARVVVDHFHLVKLANGIVAAVCGGSPSTPTVSAALMGHEGAIETMAGRNVGN